ncbi:MAG: DUF3426 domain-containing protein, partial [Gammaproteobacteria bacterium]|nr:DUF3426 domain-containing protein [Gammaproteobacteria bacterium]
ADAARRYPQWRGAIERFCDFAGSVHPRYEGVLQIKATLVNVASFRQPYPKLRFTLFNVNGQTIATRTFEPAEYLGEPLAAGERLPPRTPFQVMLDLLAPEEAAVSFEFEFL